MFKTTTSILFILILLSIQIVPAQSAPSTSSQEATILMPPEKLLADTSGFPQHEAGLTLVANMGEVEYGRLYDAMTSFAELGNSDGSTYIWGRFVQVSNVTLDSGTYSPKTTKWSDEVSVYVDITGSIIIFFPKGMPTARIINWSRSQDKTTSVLADKNILELSLDIVLNHLGKSFASVQNTINYVHFDYPEAMYITIFTLYSCRREASVLMPKGLILYEASYDLLSHSVSGTCTLYQDREIIITNSEAVKTTGKLENSTGMPSITNGVSTKLSTSKDGAYWTSSAFVLLWSVE